MRGQKPSTPSEHAGDRIAKVIARAGLASRRDAERMIGEGRVTVNGRTIASPALNITAKDVVIVDGKPMPIAEPSRLWRYHKPRGRVTTHKDPEGRPTVFQALPADLPRVVSVGRLDFNTEGLLLLTNSGELARHMELPATGWLRRYRVRAHGRVTIEDLARLAEGVVIDGVKYAGIEAMIDREQGANLWLTLGLREGKNREVRNILASLGLEVNRLIRVSYGPFQLGELAAGVVEEVPTRVLREQLGRELGDQLGLAPPARETGGAGSDRLPKAAKPDANAKPDRRSPKPKREGALVARSSSKAPKMEARPKRAQSKSEGAVSASAKPASGRPAFKARLQKRPTKRS